MRVALTRRRLAEASSRSAQRPRGVVRCRAMFGPSEIPERSNIPDSIPITSKESDWRSFRAKLVAKYLPEEDQPVEWAHALPAPELGCVLVAHPMMFTKQQTYFNLGIIFVFVHDQNGSAGLILNKPTRFTLGELDGMAQVAMGFEENQLYLGGDVGDDALNVLHRFKDLEKSVEIVDGVYLNGFDHAQKDVLKGAKNASDFKWYARYCGWSPGQLEEECKSGVWFPAACSSNLIVKDHSVTRGPADLWHQVMQLMGGEYKELSDVIIASHNTPDTSTR